MVQNPEWRTPSSLVVSFVCLGLQRKLQLQAGIGSALCLRTQWSSCGLDWLMLLSHEPKGHSHAVTRTWLIDSTLWPGTRGM